ncbi:IS110 family transposase [Terasakiella sp. SH-1]|uniref:IS110 family transposase n=1 Tax=Terasakiella sp. SH-1 TaxID=2560057 RepID=UPI001073484F|nr:IS110 family transposase [Terasakiella sp. SH-1]
MAHFNYFVGIDVGKYECLVAFSHSSKILSIPNTAIGLQELIDGLEEIKSNTLIAMEATGGYEVAFWKVLHKAGFHVRQVPPAQVRSFARSKAQIAKTDRIDAKIICRFIQENPNSGRSLPSDNVLRLNRLMAKRYQLIKVRAALKCQSRQQQEEDLEELDKAHIQFLNNQISNLNAMITTLIHENHDLEEKDRILQSIPGVGPVLSASFLAFLPELGTASDKQIACLCGIAPIARDSGKYKGKRFMSGGRKQVRDVLYQAALVASWHNPKIKTFFARLKSAGKPHKVCVIAAARKLATIANAMVLQKSEWQTD